VNNPNTEAVNYALQKAIQTQGSSLFKNQNVFVTQGTFGAVFGGKLRSQSIAKALMMFQNFPLFHNIVDTVYTHGLKEKNIKGAAAGLWWLMLVATMLEMYSRKFTKEFLARISGTSPDNKPFWDDFTKTLIGNAPFGGTIMGASLGYSEWIPVLRNFSDLGKGTQALLAGKSASARLTGGLRVAKGIATIAGIPGTYQAEEIVKNVRKGIAERKKKVNTDLLRNKW
jgi:hypothetical protein